MSILTVKLDCIFSVLYSEVLVMHIKKNLTFYCNLGTKQLSIYTLTLLGCCLGFFFSLLILLSMYENFILYVRVSQNYFVLKCLIKI